MNYNIYVLVTVYDPNYVHVQYMLHCMMMGPKWKSSNLSLHFSTGVFFIVINSQFYKDASQVMEQKQEHDNWLDKQLAFAKGCGAQHVVILQHIPWFFGNPQEDDDYFNIETNVRAHMLTKIKNAGVKYVFAGHYHRNAGGFDGNLEMIVTSAVGQQINNDKDSGMRIVRVTQEQITHEYYELDNIPANITL